MCIAGGKGPAVPPVPPPAPPAPKEADPDVRAARTDAQKKARAMSGYASTIATTGSGLNDNANTTSGKALLGA
jgi:hypothetical protein